MKIAYNPKTAAALTVAPSNNDITFDLPGQSIYVKGVKFDGKAYSIFKKYTSATAGGYNGLVPAPSYNDGSTNRFLKEDGTWGVPEGTGFTIVSSTTDGLAPKIGTVAASTVTTQADEWVLTSTKGATPTWRKLPTNAFLNYYRPILVNGTSLLGNNNTALNIVAGNDITLVAEKDTNDKYTGKLVINSSVTNITGNAATADKLKTKRKLWGQNFDGSSDVNGTIYIGKIHSQDVKDRATLSVVSNTDIPADILLGNNSTLTWALTARPSEESNKLQLVNQSNYFRTITITQNDYVGIGIVSPSQRLEVNGNVKASTFLGNLDWSYITNKPTSFTPAAHDHTRIVNTDTSGRGIEGTLVPSKFEKGLTFNTIYGGTAKSWPVNYGNVVTIRGNGDNQIVISWNANQTETNTNVAQEMYIRSKRDSGAGDQWSDWTRVITDRNYSEYCAPKTHTHTSNQITTLTGYTKATSASDLVATDTLNIALGKLEYKAGIAYSWYRTITEDDTDEIINKWDEVVDFVNNLEVDLTEEFVTRKTDQTITGKKTFSGSGADLLTINRNNTDQNASWICFKHNDTLVGYLGVSSSKNPAFSDGINLYNLLHTGNYSSYLGYIGTTPVQTASVIQALSGISQITLSNGLYIKSFNKWLDEDGTQYYKQLVLSNGTDIYENYCKIPSTVVGIYNKNSLTDSVHWNLQIRSKIDINTTSSGAGVGIHLGSFGDSGRGAGVAAVMESRWYNTTGLAFYVNHKPTDGYSEKVRLSSYGHILPVFNSGQTLGNNTNRWQYIYSQFGNFSGQITSTVANGTAPFIVASKTRVINLNADYVGDVPVTKLMSYIESANTDINDTVGNKIISYSSIVNPFDTTRSYYGVILQWSNNYRQAPSTPNSQSTWYYQLIGRTTGHGLYFRRQTNGTGWSDIKEVAFTDSDITGNAATADKLKTKVQLWGNDFDGSSDVNGRIIFPSVGVQATIKFAGGEYIDGYGNIRIPAASNVWSVMTGSTHGLSVKGNSNVGIGTDNPQYKLDVAGGAHFTDKILIDTTLTDHNASTYNCLVINVANKDKEVTLKNAPGIGFHIKDHSWGGLIFNNGFHFVNGEYSSYLDVKAKAFIKNDSSDSYVLLGGGGHKAISDFLLKSEIANQELSANLTTITKSLTVTADWMDTGIDGDDFVTGTYIVQVSCAANTGSFYDCYWSGVMSWWKGRTNDTDADEIILHRSGRQYTNTIYLRTIMRSNTDTNGLKLQIAADKNLGAAYTYTFKFKRII